MFAIRIEPARLEQRDAIWHFLLDHFRLEEPLSHSLHLTSYEAQKFFGDMVDKCLWNSVSFVALNDQNSIVGCRMNEMIDFTAKNDSKSPSRHGQWPTNVRKISAFLDTLMADLDKILPDSKKVLKFVAMSVHPDYQRRGIGKLLIDASMNLALDKECDYVCTGATAYKSQQLFEKLGFNTLRVIEHSQYLDEQNGDQIFKCDDGTTCAKLMVKKIGREQK